MATEHTDGENVRMTPAQALELAIELHQKGGIEQAEYIYTKLIEHDPQNASALQFLGMIRHTQGRNEEAVALVREAQVIAPHEPGILMNLGNVLLEDGQAEAALEAYRRMLELAPREASAWNNMGVLLRTMGRVELAEEALRKAIELDPQDAGAWHNLGNLLLSTDRIGESVQCGLKSVTLLPKNRVGRKLLGVAYAYLGETEKAKQVFREWLADEPGDPTAEHHLAALEDRPPERASDAYVERVFDDFAVSFDARLENLEYRAPEIVAGKLAAALAPGATVRLLDVGCGTGLVGPLVRERARDLVGIDLSGKMLAKAAQRGVYDRLDKAEFIAYLAAVAEPFEAMIAADALCYVGQMEVFAQNALGALVAGGHFIATFEADREGNDVALAHTGRYTHGRDYLVRTFAEAGFTEIACTPEVLRLETGTPVDGWILTARRPD
ncbi:MAG: tetratricopeptide repeat protein [Acuticoccus sp.]